MNRNEEIVPSAARQYSLIIENRESAVLTGVRAVDSFNEKEVQVETDGGELVVFGSDLHITALDLDAGQMRITGTVNGAEYLRKKQGLWDRLMG